MQAIMPIILKELAIGASTKLIAIIPVKNVAMRFSSIATIRNFPVRET